MLARDVVKMIEELAYALLSVAVEAEIRGRGEWPDKP